MRTWLLTLSLMMITALSCSSDPVVTSSDLAEFSSPAHSVGAQNNSHCLWGYWECIADPEAGTLDVSPLRTTAMHLNVVPILEPPAGAKLKISNVKFDGNICDVDVTLVHPFPGLTQYIGFDVAGIFISKGTLAGFSDPDLIMAGEGETRLLNADGYTRWWNPSEFGIDGQPIFRYKDGLMGTKHSKANFECTLNGYKLFGNDIGIKDDILGLDPKNRIAFLPGSSNTRHYKIDFSGGVIFNYAVDANWEPPAGNPPFTPEQYAPEANRPEAWAISITELQNTLYNDGKGNLGGDLKLKLEVRDHFNAGQNKIKVESPGNFNPVMSTTPISGGDGYSIYEVDIVNATPKPGSIDLLIQVESEVVGYANVIADKNVTAYFTYTADVSPTQIGKAPVALMHATTPTTIIYGQSVSFDATASTGTEPLTFEWDFNGDGVHGGSQDTFTGDVKTPTRTFNQLGDVNVTLKVSNAWGYHISDPVVVKVSYDPLDIFVDGDYTGTDSNGTPQKPYKTIQQGMNAVTAGKKVHVDYFSGGAYYDTAGLTLKSNVTLIGDNWNGGGPGKPKADNTSQIYTFSGNVSNFTLEGFEIGLAEVPGNPSHYGVSFSGSGITIRRNKFTDQMDDTGLQYGVSRPIYMNNCSNSLVEFNDVGPMYWHSDTPGEYARVLWGMYFSDCNNIVVKNNFIHDFLIDYDGETSQWGQIRMFCLHCYNCVNAKVHNNLICHIKGINDYDYRIEALMMEGISGGDKYMYYNNTIDNLDHSQSNGNFALRGVFIYSTNATGSYINNTLISNFKAPGGQSSNMTAYFSSTSNLYNISYSTAYNMGTITNYFINLILGNGCTNYPGIDPKYVNNTTPPYNYKFQSGSGCEMGDPNFIDWDDTGAPSGNPNEPNINNRSRLGCFGGPDGNWDPYNL